MTATATNEYPTRGYAALDATRPLEEFHFTRRGLRDDDILIDIQYCGICHSDLHQAHNDWGRTTYPLVPGHEIVGRVVAIGEKVDGFKAGDAVAVGCMVDSCLACDHCEQGMEQYCREGMTGTYNARDRRDGSITMGGYADKIVVRDRFVLKIPEELDPERVAPLLCAGITTYSPLRNWNVGPGQKVAVAGLGGLGHMGVKFAAAMGAEVTVLSRNTEKRHDAIALGATDFLLVSDKDAMKSATGRFDLVLDTIPVRHDVSPYLHLLRVDGALVIVGMIDKMPEVHSGILLGRKILTGSGIGGISETQEMLSYCARKDILPETETIEMHQINDAYERMQNSDVRYRFVINVGDFAREERQQ